MTIDDNIFELYSQLPNDGSKGDACRFIADLCGVKVVTSTLWVKNREFPNYLDDSKKYRIITYMQKAIELKNEIKTQ